MKTSQFGYVYETHSEIDASIFDSYIETDKMKLFCKHFWKLTNMEYMHSQKVWTESIFFPARDIRKERVYAGTFLCVKCGKTKTEEVIEEVS